MGFGRNCGFGHDREKSRKCGNRVLYRGQNAVRPTPKPFQYSRFIVDPPHFESLVLSSELNPKQRARPLILRGAQCILSTQKINAGKRL